MAQINEEEAEEELNDLVEEIVGTEEDFSKDWSDDPATAVYKRLSALAESIVRYAASNNTKDTNRRLAQLEEIVYSEHADRADMRDIRRMLASLMPKKEEE